MSEQVDHARELPDLAPGTVLPAPPPEPITRDRILRYAGASGDYNPMHVDEVTNTSAGMGGVFAHGMLGTGFLGRIVTDYLGDVPLTSLNVRCTSIVRPGDELSVEGVVADRVVGRDSTEVRFTVVARNQHGEVTHEGVATASIPLSTLPPYSAQQTRQVAPFAKWRVIG